MPPTIPNEPEPQSLLPLKPIETLILTMLASGPRHGYGIRRDILEHSQGAIELEAGGLYRHIRQLESDGLIQSSEPRRSAGDDSRRIYYELSAFGKRVLVAEMRRLRELVKFAEARRIISPARA